MKKRNFNTRKCIINNKKYFKFEMQRFCLIDNEIKIDNENSIGRGYYINLNNDYKIDVVVNKLNKIFNKKMSDELLAEINKIMSHSKEKYEQEKKWK